MGQSVGWLVGWLVGQLIGYSVYFYSLSGLTDLSTVGLSVRWSVGPPVGWLVSWSISWLVGWLFGWLVGWLVSQLIGYSVYLFDNLSSFLVILHDFLLRARNSIRHSVGPLVCWSVYLSVSKIKHSVFLSKY